MSAIILPFLKPSYDRALREQNPLFHASKGYPARRDPAAENPMGVLTDAFSILRYFKYYSRPAYDIPEKPDPRPVPSTASRKNAPLNNRFSFLN